MAEPVAVVAGVGPGIGGALARRFARDGFQVAALARSDRKLENLGPGITGFPCDVTDSEDLRAVLGEVRDRLGPVRTLLWNVGSGVWGTIDQVDEAGLEVALRTNVLAAMVAVKAVLPDMRGQGRGEIVFTGATASRRGRPATTAFAPAKAAQRSFAEALARTLGPEGIHVALIVVDGMVDLPTTRQRFADKPDAVFVSPEAVADTAKFLVDQDRRAWTFELEVRPHLESW
jgi:NAD(P)-dependent dehydrogenase (short-subunit alcohol dehydrogenase family)